MSVPGAFEPWNIDGRHLIDGGIVDNLPIEVAHRMGADIIIAVDLVSGEIMDPQEASSNAVLTLMRAYNIMVRETSLDYAKYADLFITVELKDFTRLDFDRTAEFIAAGEKAAEEMSEEIVKTADRIQRIKTNIPPRTPEGTGPFKPGNIRVNSGSAKKDQEIHALAVEYLAQGCTGEAIAQFLKKAEGVARSDNIRFYRTVEHPQDLSILISPQEREYSSVKVHLLYQTTVGNVVTSDLNLEPAVEIRGITGKGSLLEAGVELIDEPGFRLAYTQPIVGQLSVVPFMELRREITPLVVSDSEVRQRQRLNAEGGIALQLEPLRGMILFGTASILRITEANEETEVWLLGTGMEIRRMNSRLFPEQGLFLDLDCKSDREFAIVQTEVKAFMPLGDSFSAGIFINYGTDFTELLNTASSAPNILLPQLTNRDLFPVQLTREEQSGNTIAGGGIELKVKMDWQKFGIQIPAFGLVRSAVGYSAPGSIFHWNLQAGMGLRASESLGVFLRGGVHTASDGSMVPFGALDIGSFGY
jgi:hypothetical protein